MIIVVAYLLGWGAQLEVALDDARCNCESGEISIVAYLLGGGARLEVALDVRVMNENALSIVPYLLGGGAQLEALAW